MKTKGATSEFCALRRADIIRAYRQACAQAKHIKVSHVMETAVSMPASRFWVSPERAACVVSALLRGKKRLDDMRPTKARMFAVIARRAAIARDSHPATPLCEIIAGIIYSQAPEFYLSANTARGIIYKHA